MVGLVTPVSRGTVSESGSATHGFEALTLPWLADVRRYAFRLTGDPADADDLVQVTYLNALTGWHTFRPGSDVRKWLFAICRNAFLRDRSRQARIIAAEPTELDALEAARAVSGDRSQRALAALDRVDLAEAIDAAVAKLPEVYRLAVMMVDVDGMSYEEAATEIGTPVGTVRSRLYRGRRILQEQLLQQAEDLGLTRGLA